MELVDFQELNSTFSCEKKYPQQDIEITKRKAISFQVKNHYQFFDLAAKKLLNLTKGPLL